MCETKIYSPAQIKEDAAVNNHAPNLQRLRYANSKYFISLNNIVTKTYCDVTILIILFILGMKGQKRVILYVILITRQYNYAGYSLGMQNSPATFGSL